MKSIYRTESIRSLLLVFVGLVLSGLAAAQSGVTLVVRTDRSCEWQLDGHLMGLLKDGEVKKVPVSIGSHVIYSTSVDKQAADRFELEIDHGQKLIFITPVSQADSQLKVRSVDEGGKRALADHATTWTDPSTRLMWTKKDNGTDINWNQATAYCTDCILQASATGVCHPSTSCRISTTPASALSLY